MQALSHLGLSSSSVRGNSVIKLAVRFAGGGGRPGARPAFNWREKKALKIDGPKKKEFKVRPLGFDIKDLTDHVDANRGDVIIDITKLKDWKEPVREPINQYKVVDVARLYGPDKPCGPLVIPREEYTGGFQRRQMSKGRAL